MKVKIKIGFRDKDNFAMSYSKGDIVEFDKKRALFLINAGFAEEVVQTPKRKEKK